LSDNGQRRHERARDFRLNPALGNSWIVELADALDGQRLCAARSLLRGCSSTGCDSRRDGMN
jgi:hypothetical protein